MNDWLNKPWVIRVISLFLAILTFTVISFDNQDTRNADVGNFDSIFNSSQESVVLEDVPVNIQIDDEQYVVSGVPELITMELSGTLSVVQSTATQRNFDVFVDLNDLGPGDHTVPIEYDGISNRLNVRTDPESIDITIEERGEDEYQVRIDYTNSDAMQEGFEVESATVTPSVVTITSAQSVINRISDVRAVVDLEGIEESTTLDDVPVRVYDNEGNQLNVRIEPNTVTVDLSVINPNKTVPIELETTGELPEGFNLIDIEILDDAEVQLFAASEVLDVIEQIETEPVDLSTLTESTEVTIALDLPEGIRESSIDEVTVRVELEETTETGLENVEIELDNLSQDLETNFIDPETGRLNVSVSGYPSDLAGVEASDLRLSINLDGLSSGEHELPIEIDAPENVTVALPRDDVTVALQ
ncbi:YbbR domain-containing protein [Streptohalobacillus salinus]|uniref:YbbR domain-containing protein n=1 Tax=Streptohalobacillus salinus TaxID=621096 RepID=A0A2V3W3K3_9BACI|nr:CdaR family protein [Streptohalobacillus salinus]PXW86835.1 YbbR domain-containing protein [Streptohalobacillus salinus]